MSTISTWLDLAVQQIAAESYVDEIIPGNDESIKTVLRAGNNRIGFPERGFSRLTSTQASLFVQRYRVVGHTPSDASGFSATLIKNIDPTSINRGRTTATHGFNRTSS